MLQRRMTERLKEACHEDDRVHAAAMFGSFAIGEGDAFSDIEFALCIRDGAFERFDQRSWLDAARPVAAYFPDVFGHHTVLFEGRVLNLSNLMLMGANLSSRGAYARAWAVLSTVHGLLLKLVRLDEGATDHWPTPSRG